MKVNELWMKLPELPLWEARVDRPALVEKTSQSPRLVLANQVMIQELANAN